MRMETALFYMCLSIVCGALGGFVWTVIVEPWLEERARRPRR